MAIKINDVSACCNAGTIEKVTLVIWEDLAESNVALLNLLVVHKGASVCVKSCVTLAPVPYLMPVASRVQAMGRAGWLVAS